MTFVVSGYAIISWTPIEETFTTYSYYNNEYPFWHSTSDFKEHFPKSELGMSQVFGFDVEIPFTSDFYIDFNYRHRIFRTNSETETWSYIYAKGQLDGFTQKKSADDEFYNIFQKTEVIEEFDDANVRFRYNVDKSESFKFYYKSFEKFDVDINYSLFDGNVNTVDFNDLSEIQLLYVENSRNEFYESFGEDDIVTLPNLAYFKISPTVNWNPLLTFLAGSGNDTIT